MVHRLLIATHDPKDVSEKVGTLRQEEVPKFLGELALAQALAQARLVAPNAAQPAVVEPPTRMVGVKEAADLLGMSVSWLYRNADKIPGACRPNGRAWRFSTKGIEKYKQAMRPVA